jgi:hypothetical protein
MIMSNVIIDQKLAIHAIREAQSILASYIEPGPRNSDKTIQQLLDVLDRNEVVEAVDRLEEDFGLSLVE